MFHKCYIVHASNKVRFGAYPVFEVFAHEILFGCVKYWIGLFQFRLKKSDVHMRDQYQAGTANAAWHHARTKQFLWDILKLKFAASKIVELKEN